MTDGNKRTFLVAVVLMAFGAGGIGGVASNFFLEKTKLPVEQAAITETRGVKRNLIVNSVWSDLDQSEIDALTKALTMIDKRPVTIFCESDVKCGELSLNFENAFESAHWDVKVERPLIDDTVGIATSDAGIMRAINDATNGRLMVKLIEARAPYIALAIGKKR